MSPSMPTSSLYLHLYSDIILRGIDVEDAYFTPLLPVSIIPAQPIRLCFITATAASQPFLFRLSIATSASSF